MTVPIGGVSNRSMVNSVPYLPLLSWAAIQLFSMHRLCAKGTERGQVIPQAEAPSLEGMASSTSMNVYWGGFSRLG